MPAFKYKSPNKLCSCINVKLYSRLGENSSLQIAHLGGEILREETLFTWKIDRFYLADTLVNFRLEKKPRLNIFLNIEFFFNISRGNKFYLRLICFRLICFPKKLLQSQALIK